MTATAKAKCRRSSRASSLLAARRTRPRLSSWPGVRRVGVSGRGLRRRPAYYGARAAYYGGRVELSEGRDRVFLARPARGSSIRETLSGTRPFG